MLLKFASSKRKVEAKINRFCMYTLSFLFGRVMFLFFQRFLCRALFHNLTWEKKILMSRLLDEVLWMSNTFSQLNSLSSVLTIWQIWPHMEKLDAEVIMENVHPLIRKAIYCGLRRSIDGM